MYISADRHRGGARAEESNRTRFIIAAGSLPPDGTAALLPLRSAVVTIEQRCATLEDEEDRDRPTGCWAELVGLWAQLCQPVGANATITAAATTLDDITAASYLDTDALDLDHLSPTGDEP